MKTLCMLICCGLCFAHSLKAEEPRGHALMIVYPDYPVNTDTFYGYTSLVGHAGVLLISEKGLTKYYEFGRYDPDKNGVVKNREVPDVMFADGEITAESLKKVLQKLSTISGHNGRIRAAHFIHMDFDAMNKMATSDKQEKYSVKSWNCGHFAEAVILKGNARVDRPTIINFTPNNIVDEYIEEGNAEITYDPKTQDLKVGKGNEGDAKKSQ